MNRNDYDTQQDMWYKEYTAHMDDEADLNAEAKLEDEAIKYEMESFHD